MIYYLKCTYRQQNGAKNALHILLPKSPKAQTTSTNYNALSNKQSQMLPYVPETGHPAGQGYNCCSWLDQKLI